MSRDHPNHENRQPPASSGDFGVPSNEKSADRDYATATVKQHDKGGRPERSGSAGTRTSGVGGPDGGPGSNSGGDVDADNAALLGLTTSNDDPPDDRPTAASAAARNATQPAGSTMPLDAGQAVDFDGNTGAGNVNNPGRDDDSFAGEITPDEALGQG